jgi:hypothetical protein
LFPSRHNRRKFRHWRTTASTGRTPIGPTKLREKSNSVMASKSANTARASSIAVFGRKEEEEGAVTAAATRAPPLDALYPVSDGILVVAHAAMYAAATGETTTLAAIAERNGLVLRPFAP